MPRKRNQRPYNIAYYASHRAEEIRRVTVHQEATLAWLRELRQVPCMDCGARLRSSQRPSRALLRNSAVARKRGA